MKYSLAIFALLSSASAVKVKSQSQMLAEIEAMSLNTNMN
jgi:hypothetical protein